MEEHTDTEYICDTVRQFGRRWFFQPTNLKLFKVENFVLRGFAAADPP